jgi:hypothetical protein
MTNFRDNPAVVELHRLTSELKSKLRALGEQFFNEQSKAIFDEYPMLTAFSWTQYTPYFNDGSECYFGVRSDLVKLNWNDGEFIGSRYNFTDESSTSFNKMKFKEAANRITAVIESMDNEVLLAMFGDHAKITVARNGKVEVEEYDHE